MATVPASQAVRIYQLERATSASLDDVVVIDRDGGVPRSLAVADLLDGAGDTLAEIAADQGAVLIRSETAWAATPPGEAGQVLTSGGTGADPYWDAPPARTVSTEAPSGIPQDGEEWIVVDA